MKIFDMHIHARKANADPTALIGAMNEAGVFGGCVFSAPPKEQAIVGLGGGASYEERIAELRGWCEGQKDRIFPVMWIHPYEEDIIETVHRAAKDGVRAFKMLCSDYYVYEERPMAVIREIASLGLPIIFHTGILWDGNVSSKYNRPLNWEALLEVEGIRFSMGHCSWPWIDECIALYGKFLNARDSGKHVEMFFDVTPGTPEIYRKELFYKLYSIGYNVGDNIMFGLDSYADDYKSDWARKWLKIDGEILDELGVSKSYKEKLYFGNLMRFIGEVNTKVDVSVPKTDAQKQWSAVNPEVKPIIKKWYERLGFPTECDKEFYRALDEIKISDAITIESYDKGAQDGRRSLLSYLYLCERTEEKCRALGIPESIITETLADIVIWCVHWSNIKGKLHLGELDWLARHVEGRLFKLGRLQFCMAGAETDIPAYNIKKGDPVLEIHIPEGKKFDISECRASIETAKEFFAKYFPDFNYKAFTCHSWLLDDTLKEYLPEESGIIRFGNMFDKVRNDKCYALLRYIFAWDTTPLNLKHRYPTTSLAEKIQKAVLGGKEFYETLGVIEK